MCREVLNRIQSVSLDRVEPRHWTGWRAKSAQRDQGIILEIKSYSRHVFRELFVFTILRAILLKLKMCLLKLQNSLSSAKRERGKGQNS